MTLAITFKPEIRSKAQILA